MVEYVLMPFGFEGLAWGINGVLWIADTVGWLAGGGAQFTRHADGGDRHGGLGRFVAVFVAHALADLGGGRNCRRLIHHRPGSAAGYFDQ